MDDQAGVQTQHIELLFCVEIGLRVHRLIHILNLKILFRK